jgi:hypothetical protein
MASYGWGGIGNLLFPFSMAAAMATKDEQGKPNRVQRFASFFFSFIHVDRGFNYLAFSAGARRNLVLVCVLSA